MNRMETSSEFIQFVFYHQQKIEIFISENIRSETEFVTDINMHLQLVEFFNGVEDHCSLHLSKQTVDFLCVGMSKHDENNLEDAL